MPFLAHPCSEKENNIAKKGQNQYCHGELHSCEGLCIMKPATYLKLRIACSFPRETLFASAQDSLCAENINSASVANVSFRDINKAHRGNTVEDQRERDMVRTAFDMCNARGFDPCQLLL